MIVGRDATARRFADLRGCSWAYNEPLSHSGYGVTRFRLVEMGETRGFFGDVVEAGFHQRAIEMVADGEVDASAIDSQVLGIALRDDPSLAERIKVIDALGPSTIQPIAVSRHVDPELRDAIREALLGLADDPLVRERLAVGLVDRLVAVDGAAYDDIRRMLDACDAAGFMVLR